MPTHTFNQWDGSANTHFRAAVLFRQGQASPTESDHLLPHIRVKTSVTFEQSAYCTIVGVVSTECFGTVQNHRLFFTELD